MTSHSVILKSGFVAANDSMHVAKLTEFVNVQRRLQRNSSIELVLPERNIIELPNSPGSIACLSGSLWLTRDRDATDYVIESGNSFRFEEGEKIVVQSMKHSRLALFFEQERPLPFVPLG